MTITEVDVKKIARLAKLNLSDTDLHHQTEKLSQILDFIAQMNSIDTSNVEPMSHTLDLSQRLREDAITEPDLRDKFQQIAPMTEAGLYLVPKVIE